MATLKQKTAVDKLVENSRNTNKKTKGEILLESGYSLATAIKPTQVTESEGFKKELKRYGLTEGLVTKALVSDIKAKPRKRFFELNLGAEILGMKERVKNIPQGNTVNVVIIPSEAINRHDRPINSSSITNSGGQASLQSS